MRKFLVAYKDFDIIDYDIITTEVFLNKGEKANEYTFKLKIIDMPNIPFPYSIISWSLIEDKNMKRFVTCSINRVVDFANGVPHFKRFKYVIECENLTKAYDVACDINSIDGIQYVRICKTNKDKSRILLSQDDYRAL